MPGPGRGTGTGTGTAGLAADFDGLGLEGPARGAALRADWSELPFPALLRIAAHLSRMVEAEVVRETVSIIEDGRHVEIQVRCNARRDSGGHDGLLAFALTCRAFRRAQIRLGTLRTRWRKSLADLEPRRMKHSMWAFSYSSTITPGLGVVELNVDERVSVRVLVSGAGTAPPR